MAKIFLIRGLPGSGKSTLAANMVKEGKADIHLEADMCHIFNGKYHYSKAMLKQAHEWCQMTAEIMLHNGKNVVVANTFIAMWQIKPYMNMGFDIEIINATGEFKSVHDVPEEEMDKMRGKWEDIPNWGYHAPKGAKE
jgi:predicted kinase